jgi:chemotaxis protein methyltransferase CheR
MKPKQPGVPAHNWPTATVEGRPIIALTSEQFSRLRDHLASYSGVYLDSARQRLLEIGLAQRLSVTGDDPARYERRIQGPDGRGELRQLAELVLNHETFFFRNGPHLRALQDVLLAELHLRKPAATPIRIWSAGCATGEEAYSLAIVAYETLGRPLARPVEIWATDLSEAALRRARAGVYRGRAIGNLSPKVLARYFRPQGDGHAVGDALRALVRFEALNLLDPFPAYANEIDIIFCQNVTIYFQLATCRTLMERFHNCLPTDGLLFLGFSETLWNIFTGFRSREVAGAYVYYKGGPKSTPIATRADPVAPVSVDTGRQPTSKPRATGPTNRQRGESTSVSRYDKRSFHDQAALRIDDQCSDDVILQRGRELLARGQSAEALEALQHISQRSACASQALTLIARAHADRGELDLAVAEVQRALEIDTLNDAAHLLLGVIYRGQNEWQSAIQQFERARYLRPESALISFHLADAYRQLGRIGPAAREYQNTLRKLDGHPPDTVLDGVAVGWLRETCQRQLEYLPEGT